MIFKQSIGTPKKIRDFQTQLWKTNEKQLILEQNIGKSNKIQGTGRIL